ncbi:MAG TPA: SpoIIE family protein phosphatase [Coriobacteriia bacterium]|nr:SpoIIE family protein phosphatase [Coriobacteriia bacterium]
MPGSPGDITRDAIGTPEQEREALVAVMENAREASLVYLDCDFNFVLVNSTYADACQMTKEQMIGKNHFELFPNAENEAIFRQARETGEPVEFKEKPFVFEYQKWRGVSYWDWTLTPIKGSDGAVRAFVFSLVDVTDRVRRVQLSEALGELDVLIHSTLDFDAILHQIISDASEASGCEWVALNLRHEGEWEVYESSSDRREARGSVISSERLPAAELSAITRAPVVVNDVKDFPEWAEALESTGVRSVLDIPLIIRDEVVGVLGFHYHSAPVAFSATVIDFAERLGASLSLAMANAQLYERERRIAEKLQEALLALPTHINGIDFAHTYQSASDASVVGGDFYDLFELEGETIGITIGDISGKGIDAAVLTSLVKNTIRAHAIEEEKSPADVMRLANRILLHSSPDDVFATVFYAELNRETGDLRYCNAGHCTGAIVTPAGDVLELPQTGPLVGAFGRVRFSNAETVLDRGSVLFLYTDGLIEARRGAEQFSEERVFGRLGARAGSTPAEIADGIIDDAVEFADGEMADDVATLAIRRT